MPVSDTKLNEGDAFAAAGLNTRFDAIETAINALDPDDIEQRSLGDSHLPGLVGETELNPSPGLRILGGLSALHTYTNEYPTFAVVTDGSTPASVTWTALDLGTNSLNINAILVLANVEVVRAHEDNAGAGDPGQYSAAIRIAYQNAASSWVGLDHTERFVSGEAHTVTTGAASYDASYHDGCIRTLVTDTVLGGVSLKGLRLEVAFNEPGTAGVDPLTVELLRYNLTIIPLHCEEA